VIGTLVYATVIVHLQDIVSELDVTSDLHKGRAHKLQSFLVREQTAMDFIVKGRTYMEKLWSTQRGAQSAEIRAFVPPALYAATLNSCTSRFLPQLFFVQKCHAAFQSAFLSNLKVTHYLKDDVLFRTAEAANRLYFVCQGEVSLVSIDLQTETCTADAAPPLRHRQSFLGTLGQRRSSLQGSPFKNAADAAPDKSAESRPRFSITSFAARRSIVLPSFVMGKRTSSASTATTKTAALGPGSTRKKGRRTSYLKVQDGFIGETEFFTRSCYSCSAKVNTDAVIFEIDFDTFRELVVRFGLQELYKKALRRGESQLQRNSTLSVVQKLDNNMANKKMAKMMSVCLTETPQLRCWLPGSPRAQGFEALAFLLTVLMAFDVPYFTAFPHSDVATQLSIDALSTVVFTAGMYLRMNLLAVMHDGTLITEPSEISKHYIAHHLRADVLATLPVGLLVYAASGSTVVYGALRWTSLLRLHRVSGWIDQALTAASTVVGQPLTDGARRVLAAIVAVLYMAHLAGCLFCTIGRVEMEQSAASWITANDFQAGQNFSAYLRSYYWALYTLTTVGYGSLTLPSNCERIFAMMVMVLGSILSAMLSALLNSLVETSDQSSGLIRYVPGCSSRTFYCQSCLT
jgi:CRP-like cAMP-binding protein